jgi:hypothetical protein
MCNLFVLQAVCYSHKDGINPWVVLRVLVASRQAVGLANGPHGRRPTGAFAPRNYGVKLESAARPSPDSSGSPQQYDVIAFCTAV